MGLYKSAFAALYDRFERREHPNTAPVRRRLLEGVDGDILELGAGTGANFTYYPATARVTATDYNPHMLQRARAAAERSSAEIMVEQANAMRLPFPDASFDVVVGCLVFCSIRRPGRALQEARRVLRPGGDLRLFEHVRSPRPAVARLQAVASPAWGLVSDGCHLDRNTSASVRAAGFHIRLVEAVDYKDAPPLRHELILASKVTPGAGAEPGF